MDQYMYQPQRINPWEIEANKTDAYFYHPRNPNQCFCGWYLLEAHVRLYLSKNRL
jgi:hypothetical protein